LEKKILDAEKQLSEPGKYSLTRLLHSAKNLNQLMEDVFEYSQFNSNEKAFKNTDLNILIKKTIHELKTTIIEHRVAIDIDPLPTVSIVPSEINKLFAHLITNSIKYAKSDMSPQIKISSEDVSQEELNDVGIHSDSRYIKLTVTDNGTGFDKDYEKLIFEPFYKLHNNEKHYGSGLGLTAAKKIVKNHRGFIKAVSEPSEGTVVSIYLPL